MEGEVSKLSMTQAERASCSPGEVEEQLQWPPELLFQSAVDDTTSAAYQAMHGNGSLGEASSTAKAGASRNLGHMELKQLTT